MLGEGFIGWGCAGGRRDGDDGGDDGDYGGVRREIRENARENDGELRENDGDLRNLRGCAFYAFHAFYVRRSGFWVRNSMRCNANAMRMRMRMRYILFFFLGGYIYKPDLLT